MAEPRATLTLDGRAHSGWSELRITRSIESLAGEYEFTLSARDYSDQPRWPLRTGAACTVAIGATLVATGFVDALNPSYDGQGHDIRLSVRDATADLIDCSAIAIPGSWSGRKVEAIIAELVKPFGIAFDGVQGAGADSGAPVKKFALQQGETVFAAIDRLARYRGLLPITSPEGRLQLVKPDGGGAVARLVEGVNIIAGSATHDARDRFSAYIVKGQAAGDDRAHGKTVAAVRGEARDSAMARYRPLLIIGEEQATPAELKARAAWEASVRAGRAQRATLTVAGWHRDDGQLWTPNVRVMVAAPGLFVEGLLLVSEVALVKSNSGTTAELTVTPAEAWSLLPVKEGADQSALGNS